MENDSYTKKPLPKRELIFRWAFSYIIVFLIPLLVFTLVSMQYIRVLDDEVRYYNELSADMLRTRMDYIIDEANNFAAEAAVNPLVSGLQEYSSRGDIPPLALNNIKNELNRMRVRRDQIESFYVYFPGLDLVINDSTYNKGANFYSIYLSNSSLNQEEWLNLINDPDRRIKLHDFSFNSPGARDPYIILSRPVSNIQYGPSFGRIFFLIRRDYFIPPQDQESHQDIYIIDKISGQAVYPSNQNIDKPKNVITVTADSKISDWQYTVVESKDMYLGKVNFIRNIFILCLAFSFFLSLFYIFLVVKRNWRSFNSAVMVVENEETIISHPEGPKNEYQYFQGMIFSLKKEKHLMDGRFMSQQAVLKSNVITSLIKNSGETRNISLRELESYGIIFSGRIFFVLLIPNETGANNGKGRPYTDELTRLFAAQGNSVYPFQLEKFSGLVINTCESDRDKINRNILSNIGMAGRSASGKTGAELNCSCSETFYSHLDLNKAYIQALDAMEFKKRIEYKNLVFYRDVSEILEQKKYIYQSKHELAVSEAIKAGNDEKIPAIIRDVVDENIRAKVSPQMMKYLVYEIASTMAKECNRLDKKVFESVPDINISKIIQNDDFEEACYDLETVAKTICLAVKAANKKNGIDSQKDFELSKMAELYIKKYYSDKTLNVSSTAYALKVSTVYLSRIFKKYKDLYISDYINTVRIEQAKALLIAGFAMNPAADACGFGSFRTFMRVFKKYEGITPGQFRSMRDESRRSNFVMEV